MENFNSEILYKTMRLDLQNEEIFRLTHKNRLLRNNEENILIKNQELLDEIDEIRESRGSVVHKMETSNDLIQKYFSLEMQFSNFRETTKAEKETLEHSIIRGAQKITDLAQKKY